MENKKRRLAVRAESWQVSILRKMHEKHPRPTAVQRYQLAVDTGLDKVWIKAWFTRENRKLRICKGVSIPTALEDSIIKPDLSLSEAAIHSDRSISLRPSPLQSTSSQGTLNISPALDVLLTLVNGQADEDCGYWAGSTCILAPIPRRILPPIDFLSLEYNPDVSRPASHSTMEEQLTQRTLPQHTSTSTWIYSRDPLHGRYPDFSNFFVPTLHNTFCDAGRFLELSPTAVSSDDLTFLGFDHTIRSLDHISATTH